MSGPTRLYAGSGRPDNISPPSSQPNDDRALYIALRGDTTPPLPRRPVPPKRGRAFYRQQKLDAGWVPAHKILDTPASLQTHPAQPHAATGRSALPMQQHESSPEPSQQTWPDLWRTPSSSSTESVDLRLHKASLALSERELDPQTDSSYKHANMLRQQLAALGALGLDDEFRSKIPENYMVEAILHSKLGDGVEKAKSDARLIQVKYAKIDAQISNMAKIFLQPKLLGSDIHIRMIKTFGRKMASHPCFEDNLLSVIRQINSNPGIAEHRLKAAYQ